MMRGAAVIGAGKALAVARNVHRSGGEAAGALRS